jgi:hypothetical protein
MRRAILYIGGAIILLSALVTIGRITTTPPAKIPVCPRCGGKPDAERLGQDATTYFCDRCSVSYVGPVRSDFSWMGALQNWLEQ